MTTEYEPTAEVQEPGLSDEQKEANAKREKALNERLDALEARALAVRKREALRDPRSGDYFVSEEERDAALGRVAVDPENIYKK